MFRRRATAAIVALLALDAYLCTTFCMNVNGRVVFGANYDWYTSTGLIVINKRSVAKQSLTQRPVRWASRCASITFNQYGRDFPSAGMNEAGLVVGSWTSMPLDVPPSTAA